MRFALAIWLILPASLGAAEMSIEQKDKKFSKASVDIKVGDSVKFLNADNTTHHLMYKVGGKRVSVKQPQGDKPHVQKFDESGQVTVRCAIHPKMKLVINVK